MNPMTIRRFTTAFLAFFLLALASATPAAMPQLNLQLETLEDALNLTPAQKDQYDAAVGATKRMALQMALIGLQVKEKLAAELAKPHPDFSVLLEARRAIVEDGRALRREARDEWRKLYALLDADQVATLKRFIEEKIDHAGLLHEFMRQLILGRDG